MMWLTFGLSAALLVAAAIKLAEYGDAIAYRTGMGGMFVGTLLMAGATSLPELLTAINSLGQDVVDLAAGNMLGSNMFNMLLVGLLSLAFFRQRVLRRVAINHALTGSVAALLITMVSFFLLARLDVGIGWVGLDSLSIMVAYVVGVWLIRASEPLGTAVEAAPLAADGVASLRRALIGFAAASAVLVLVTPHLVRSSAEIAEVTGLGTGFVGTALLATITSLPELVAVVAAARLGAFDLAVGNLFGSNIFNMAALGLTDLFFTQGYLLSAIAPEFALVGLLGLLLTGLGLIGNLARLERLVLLVELDAILLVVGYILGLAFLYSRGLGL